MVLKATVNEVVDDKALIFKYRAEVMELIFSLREQSLTIGYGLCFSTDCSIASAIDCTTNAGAYGAVTAGGQ